MFTVNHGIGIMNQRFSNESLDILLVEDNPGDVRLVQEAFKSLEQKVELHVATNGEAAIQYFHSHLQDDTAPDPDIILLDLNLPRIDGFAVLEILNEELIYPPPVIILSSSKSVEDINRCYRAGCSAYLTKPDDISEFASMARAIKEFWYDRVWPPQI